MDIWAMYTVEHYPNVNEKGIVNVSGNRMELETMILYEVTHTRKEMLHGLSLQVPSSSSPDVSIHPAPDVNIHPAVATETRNVRRDHGGRRATGAIERGIPRCKRPDQGNRKDRDLQSGGSEKNTEEEWRSVK